MKKLIFLFALIIGFATDAQSWVTKADAPEGRHHPISFSLNGKGYAISGTDSIGQSTDDVYEYDPISDTWNVLSDFPGLARSYGIGTVANGKAYFGFGATDTAYLKDFWSFDPTNGTYTQLANCGCSSRKHPAMISIGNRIYVGLGNDVTGDKNDWWLYRIDDDTWTQLANLPGLGRHHPFMFNAGGELFAGLGHSGPTIFKDWYKLDTISNTWTMMSQFPGEGRVAGTQFNMHGYGFILSGDGDNHSFMNTGEMWRYNPATDTWLEFQPHPGNSRWAPGSFVINNEIFFFGGVNSSSNYPKDLLSFDIAAATVGFKENVIGDTYVYPNPAKNNISWEFDASITEVILINTIGEVIASNNLETKYMNVSHLNQGVYFVQFLSKNEILKTSKIIIQR